MENIHTDACDESVLSASSVSNQKIQKGIVTDVTPENRQEALLKALQVRSSMTIDEAWKFGNELGFYRGGEIQKVKDDLNALCTRYRGRVLRVDKRWADNWKVRR